MVNDPSIAERLSQEDNRIGSAVLADRLRQLILAGTFPPGSTVSQGELAAMLQVGRTPLREAVRLLQQEGWLQAELNQRIRIPGLDPQVIDGLYAARIMQEALGVQLTVPRMTAYTLAMGESILQEMDKATEKNDLLAWQDPHHRFHRLLVSHAGDYLERIIASYADRCEYYRQVYYRYNETSPDPSPSWEEGQSEHRLILEAYQQRDPVLAVRRLAHHLSRAALTVLTHVAPAYDPIALDAALRLTLVEE
jgi:DNA-binding GntR family transcriptional regulator